MLLTEKPIFLRYCLNRGRKLFIENNSRKLIIKYGKAKITPAMKNNNEITKCLLKF
jgi:hypothetical protein